MKTLIIANNNKLSSSSLFTFRPILQSPAKKASILLATLSLCLCSAKGYSQIIDDIGGIGLTSHTKVSFKDMPSSDTNPDTKFQLNTFDAWIPLPPVTIGKTTIFSNLNYRYMDFNYDNNQVESPDQIQKIQEIKSVIIVRHPIAPKWSILAIAMPTLASDTKRGISTEDLILDGILGVSKRFGRNNNLEIGFGVHAMYSYGDLLITPGISIDYHSNDNKWLAQFYWPRLNVLYSLTPKTQVGIAGSIDWTRFNLKNYISKDKEVDYAQFSSIHAGLQVHQQLFKNITLQVQAGMGLGNSYELFDTNQKTVTKYSISTMPYAKISLSYRMGKR